MSVPASQMWTPPEDDFSATASAAPAAAPAAAWAPPDEDFSVAPQTNVPADSPAARFDANTAIGPQSDFGQWVGHTIGSLATSAGNAIPDLVSGGTWHPFTQSAPSPGVQRFQQKIDAVRAELNSAIPETSPSAAPEAAAAYQASQALTPFGENLQRVAGDVSQVAPLAGGLGRLAGVGEDVAAEAAAPAARAPSEAPAPAQLLTVGKDQGAAPAAPLAPATAVPPVTHTAEGPTHTFTSPNGVTTAQRRGQDLQIVDTHTDPDAQGTGQGVARAEQAHQVATAQGGQLISDTSVSKDAQNVYGGLARRGYAVQQNPSVEVGPDGTMRSTNGRPVFQVGPKALNGMPTQVNVPGAGALTVGPSAPLRQAAQDYAASTGRPFTPPKDFVTVDPGKAQAVAKAYDAMPATPKAPATAASYNAFKQETVAQFQALKNAGYTFDFGKPGEEPYATPRQAQLDLQQNKHLTVRPSADEISPDHPLAEDSGVTIGGRPANYNDVFRATHDAFGHAMEGVGFRGDGEYNAYLQHRAMYSPEAQGALASETLGQNAWVNHGPSGEANRAAGGDSTVYAPQKAGLMPKSIWGGPNPAGREVSPVQLEKPGVPVSTLSAEKGEVGGQSVTPEQNATRTRALEADLRQSGLSWQRTNGSYAGTPERSFAVNVPDASARGKVEGLAKKYDQESIAHFDANRNGTLHYLDGRTPDEPMGALKEIPAEQAARVKGWTQDETGKVYSTETPPAGPPKFGATAPTDRGARVGVLKNLGINEARESALTGDAQAGSDDVQTAKLNNAAGERMRDVMGAERRALDTRADTMVQRSGGTAGTDASSLMTRGQTIAAPIEEGYQHIDNAMRAMYKDAATEAKARGAVLGTSNVDKWLAEAEKNGSFIRSTDAADFRQRIDAARKLFGTDKAGATVEQAENFRKWIGEAYDYRTGDLNGGLKDALDDDVSAAGGADLYKAARALRTFRATNFDDPKGIKSLLGGNDRLGINRPTPLERIPDHVANMPVEQFNHVVNTIQTIGEKFPELQSKAAAAIGEIRAQQANRIANAGRSTAGMWNAKGVTKEIAAQGPKIARVWGPDGQQMLHELQQGGEILKADQSYKGAAVQAHNLVNMGLGAVGKTAEVAGAALHGFPGYLVGKGLKGAVEHLSGNALKSAVEKRITDLSEEPTAAAPAPAGGGVASVPRSPFQVAQRGPLSQQLPGQRGGPKYTGPSNIQKILPHLTETEKAQLRSDSAQRLVDHFFANPKMTHEMAASALAGGEMKGWYKGAVNSIAKTFGPDAPRFAGILAAMSPLKSVAQNLEDAVNVWTRWTEEGKPQDPATIAKIVAEEAPYLKNTTVPNVTRVLTSPAPEDEKFALSGPKVDSFMRNLRGDVNAVTLDGWMAKWARVDQKLFGGKLNQSGPGKSGGYLAMSAHVREAAKMLTHETGQTWTPAEVQETVWSWVKSASELADSTGKSIPELMKSGAINGQLIGDTPTFQRLLGQHAGKLGRIGLSVPEGASGAPASQLHGIPGDAISGTPGEASAALAQKLAPHLKRVASRVEAARNEVQTPGTSAEDLGGAAGPDVPF